jgi:outer membrane protein TolC
MTPRVLDLDSDALIKLAGEHNPELAALYHDVERDREAVELSGLAFWPDPTIGVEWTYLDPRGAFEPPVTTSASGPPVVNRKSEVGDDNWAIMLQFNVPLWRDRIKAGRREAAQRLESTLQERRDKTDAVRFRVFDAWVRVKSHRETLRLLETTLIPQASQTYEVSLTAYQAGRADFLDVIENWHRLLDFELMLHREVVGAERAFSELQRHVGLELDSMALPSDPTNEGSQP